MPSERSCRARSAGSSRPPVTRCVPLGLWIFSSSRDGRLGGLSRGLSLSVRGWSVAGKQWRSSRFSPSSPSLPRNVYLSLLPSTTCPSFLISVASRRSRRRLCRGSPKHTSAIVSSESRDGALDDLAGRLAQQTGRSSGRRREEEREEKRASQGENRVRERESQEAMVLHAGQLRYHVSSRDHSVSLGSWGRRKAGDRRLGETGGPRAGMPHGRTPRGSGGGPGAQKRGEARPAAAVEQARPQTRPRLRPERRIGALDKGPSRRGSSAGSVSFGGQPALSDAGSVNKQRKRKSGVSGRAG